MNPAAVTAGILCVDVLPGIWMQLAVDGIILLVRQSDHDSKPIVFGKNIAYQFLLQPVSDPPAVLSAIGKDDLLLCRKCLGQPFVQRGKESAVLTAIRGHLGNSWFFCFIQHSFVHSGLHQF